MMDSNKVTITNIQEDLIAKGFKLDADGIMGPITLNAIRLDAAAARRGEETTRMACLREAVALQRPGTDPGTTLNLAKSFERYVTGAATEKVAPPPLVVSEAALEHGLSYALNYLSIDAKAGQKDHVLAASLLPLVLHGMESWVESFDPATTPNKWSTPNKSPDPEQVRSGAVGVR